MLTADRVKETTTTIGTGDITLAGAAPGFQAFSDAFPVGTRIMYAIVGTTEWETGEGTLTGATTISRDTVRDSSNANALVNFSAGTKDVFTTFLAAQSRRADVGNIVAMRRGYAWP
jgi:hypothetical protein